MIKVMENITIAHWQQLYNMGAIYRLRYNTCFSIFLSCLRGSEPVVGGIKECPTFLSCLRGSEPIHP